MPHVASHVAKVLLLLFRLDIKLIEQPRGLSLCLWEDVPVRIHRHADLRVAHRWRRSERAKTIGSDCVSSVVRYGGLARVEAQAALSEGNPHTVPDDQVVEHVHIKQLAGLHDLARHQDILRAGVVSPEK